MSRERALLNAHGGPHSRVCGVDEAGRGPLAGPVVACAVVLDPALAARDQPPRGLNDSKRLSHSARERLLNELIQSTEIGIGIAEPHEIERRNILWASLEAMRRAVEAVGAPFALVDGNRVPRGVRGEAVVGGDGTVASIAAASIVAKVVRDRMMASAETRWPGYGLAAHKGYPTAAHRARLAERGACPIHRWGFKGVDGSA